MINGWQAVSFRFFGKFPTGWIQIIFTPPEGVVTLFDWFVWCPKAVTGLEGLSLEDDWPRATFVLQKDSKVCSLSSWWSSQSASFIIWTERKNCDVWNCLWRGENVLLYNFFKTLLEPIRASLHLLSVGGKKSIIFIIVYCSYWNSEIFQIY